MAIGLSAAVLESLNQEIFPHNLEFVGRRSKNDMMVGINKGYAEL